MDVPPSGALTILPLCPSFFFRDTVPIFRAGSTVPFARDRVYWQPYLPNIGDAVRRADEGYLTYPPQPATPRDVLVGSLPYADRPAALQDRPPVRGLPSPSQGYERCFTEVRLGRSASVSSAPCALGGPRGERGSRDDLPCAPAPSPRETPVQQRHVVAWLVHSSSLPVGSPCCQGRRVQ